MLIDNQRVYLVYMLSGWYQAISPCPVTASVRDGVQGIRAVDLPCHFPRGGVCRAAHLICFACGVLNYVGW